MRKADFGDGYTQASPAGLNHIRQIVSLKWDGIDLDTMQALRDFLAERGGYKAFWYQPHGHSAPVKWTCNEWSGVAGVPWTFAAKLRQSFTLDT